MEPLTIDTMRTIATAQGLELSDEELAGLLPLVQAGRSVTAALSDAPLADVEPACQYRVL